MIFQTKIDKREFSLTENAIAYSLKQLAQRAGMTDFHKSAGNFQIFAIPIFYAHPNEVLHSGKKIIIPCRKEDWFKLLEKSPRSIAWLPSKGLFPNNSFIWKTDIPIIFPINFAKNTKLVECLHDRILIFHIDIIATTFFMLTRWEETINPAQDKHGRFPAFESVAYKQGFLHLPIVDLYSLILREWIKIILPERQPAPLRLKVNTIHDVDWVSRFSSIPHFLKVVGSELIKKKRLNELFRQFNYFRIQIANPKRDDFFQSIYDIAILSEQYSFVSKFYFMATDTNKYQQGYSPSSQLIRECFFDLEQRGHKIGLHPSYYTLGVLKTLTHDIKADHEMKIQEFLSLLWMLRLSYIEIYLLSRAGVHCLNLHLTVKILEAYLLFCGITHHW